MNLLCRLGLHRWQLLFPLGQEVLFDQKLWLPVGGLGKNKLCTRCGKLSPGTCLIPSGWDGPGWIVGGGPVYEGEPTNDIREEDVN